MFAMHAMRTALAAFAALAIMAMSAMRPVAVSSGDPGAVHSAGDLLVVHTKGLQPAAEAWRDWRTPQGWKVSLMPCTDDSPDELRDRIRAWAAESAREPRAVLLLGEVPASGGAAPTAGIPTFRFKQRDPAIRDRRDPGFTSDGPYQDLDDDGIPDLMLGRIPVAAADDALRVLAKIKSWESAPPGDSHRRVELVGGEGRFGPYDALLETLTAALLIDAVPPEFELRATYAKASSPFCPPPSRVREIVRGQALSGALLFNYVGHGHATGLDALWWKGGRERLLEVADLGVAAPAPAGVDAAPRSSAEPATAAADGARPGGAALLVCCSAGWFDDAARSSLAEALLLHPRGPVAVVAGSRPTHPYANAIVERDGVRSLLERRARSVGAWDLEITRSLARSGHDELDAIAAPIAAMQRWPLTLRELRRQHVLLYNLIGDPTTRFVHPPLGDLALSMDEDGMLCGRVDGAPKGAVAEVALVERRRARPRGVFPSAGQDDPKLDEIAGRNWPRANDRVRWRAEVPLVEGRFRTRLPEPPPTGAELILTVIRVAGEPDAPHTSEAVDRPGAATASGTLIAVSSHELASLLRSRLDEHVEQGLPPDRGNSPRRTRSAP